MDDYSSSSASLHRDDTWSKKVTKRRRRSIAKDRRAIAITRVSSPTTPMASVGASVADTTPRPLTLPKPANDDSKASKKTTRIHAWEHTTDYAKVVSANRAIALTGRAYAFTLNLSPKQIAAANDNLKGFTDHFKRRISRSLTRADTANAVYWFAVDVTPAGRPHLHGAIEDNDNLGRDSIERALCAAGGKWASIHHARRQCDLQPLCTPDVWANYCLRNQGKVKRLIVGKAVSITGPLRRRAKCYYDALR
jgi:hypothetical protein